MTALNNVWTQKYHLLNWHQIYYSREKNIQVFSLLLFITSRRGSADAFLPSQNQLNLLPYSNADRIASPKASMHWSIRQTLGFSLCFPMCCLQVPVEVVAVERWLCERIEQPVPGEQPSHEHAHDVEALRRLVGHHLSKVRKSHVVAEGMSNDRRHEMTWKSIHTTVDMLGAFSLYLLHLFSLPLYFSNLTREQSWYCTCSEKEEGRIDAKYCGVTKLEHWNKNKNIEYF